MRMSRALAAALAFWAAASFASVAPASAGVLPVFDLENWLKAAVTAAQTAHMALQQAQQLQTQISALQEQGQQLLIQQRNITSLPSAVWSDVKSNLNSLANLLNEDTKLSITSGNLDQEYQQLFPQYVPTANYGALYSQWDNNTQAAALNALKAAGGILNEQGGDINTLLANEGEINSATGQMQVLQAAASISAQQVEQLQKLLVLNAYRTQAEHGYMLQQQAVQKQNEQHDQALEAWLQGSGSATSW